jgi:hypothetical protein
LVYHPDKLESRTVGPYTITHVYTNGTLSIEVSPGVIERINVRRVRPYRRGEVFFSPFQGAHFLLATIERQNVMSRESGPSIHEYGWIGRDGYYEI